MIQVFYSTQSPFLKTALKKALKETFPTRDELNFVSLDMNECRYLDIYNECEFLPLGYEKKAVVVEHFFPLGKSKTKLKIAKGDSLEELLSYFKNPNPGIDLYLLADLETIDEKGKIASALRQGGATFTPLKAFSEAEWKKFIPLYFKKRNVEIDKDAEELLFQRITSDYSLFLTEANKLISYVYPENRITYQIVEKLTIPPLENDVFLLSRALIKGEQGNAIKIYQDLKVHNVSAVTLLNLLAKEFRALSEVAILLKEGYETYNIASALSFSPGRVNAILYSLRKLSIKKIHDGQNGIFEALKNIMTGQMSEDLAFNLFLANFINS